MRDFNGNIKTLTDKYDGVHGDCQLRDHNTDGERMLQFTESFDIAIENTFLKKYA